MNISEESQNVKETLQSGCQVTCVNLSSSMADSDILHASTEQMDEGSGQSGTE